MMIDLAVNAILVIGVWFVYRKGIKVVNDWESELLSRLERNENNGKW